MGMLIPLVQRKSPRISRNDVPNRFWSTIEPYCAEITNEDLKILEDILRSHEDDADYQKVGYFLSK